MFKPKNAVQAVEPAITTQAVLYHCGIRMRATRTVTEGGFRTRYLKCSKCGLTSKTVSEITSQLSKPIFPPGGGAPLHCGRPMRAEGEAVAEEKRYRVWRCDVCGRTVQTFIAWIPRASYVATAAQCRRH